MPNVENKVKDIIGRGDQNPIGAYTGVTEVSEDTTPVHGQFVLVDASGGDITITLPKALNSTSVTVKRVDSSGNALTIETPNNETIDGSSSISIGSQYGSEEIVSDGSDYYIKQ